MIKVLCNTSPVIGLLYIGKLDLLWTLFDEVYIPQAVLSELTSGSEQYKDEIAKIHKAVSDGHIIIYNVKNSEVVKQLYGKLHYGELEVIVGAKELEADFAVIDERAARKMASEFLIDTIGVMGILLASKKKGLIINIKGYIDSLRKSGYRISEQLYRQILAEAQEE